MQALCRFNIANSFPDGKEEVTYDELAKACGLSEPNLRRIVRVLMTRRIFCEPQKGKIAHTSASKFFLDNRGIRQWLSMVLEEMWPAATKVKRCLSIPKKGI
jgi:hypothetical protein